MWRLRGLQHNGSHPAVENPRCTVFRAYDTVFRMKAKITLSIDASVFIELKAEAARSGQTMSALVEAALRLLLEESEGLPELPPLPSFSGGAFMVDVADRTSLYEAMGGR